MAQYDVTHVANIEASGVAAQSFLYYVSGRERDTRWETSKLQGGHHCLKPAEARRAKTQGGCKITLSLAKLK